MLKKTITYEDYNGVTRTEDFYFNLSKAELIEMEMGTEGGYAEKLQKIVDSKDTPATMKIFKELIAKSYGVRSDDGRKFKKSPEISEDFMQSAAYDEFFLKIATDVDEAIRFVNGIIPKDIDTSEATKQLALNK